MPTIESIFENIIGFIKRIGFTIYYILFKPKTIIHSLLNDREKYLIKPSIFLVIILLIIPLIWKDIEDASYLDINSIAGVSKTIFDADFYETFLFTFPFSVVIYVIIFCVSKMLFLSKRYTTLFVKMSLYYFSASNIVFTIVNILFYAFYPEISSIAYGVFDGHLNKIPNYLVSIMFVLLPLVGISTSIGINNTIGLRFLIVPVISGFAFYFYFQLYSVFDPFILSEQNNYSIRSGYYQDDGYYDNFHYNLFLNHAPGKLECEVLLHNNDNRPIFLFTEQTFSVFADDPNSPIARFRIDEKIPGKIISVQAKSVMHFKLAGKIDSIQYRKQGIKTIYDNKFSLHYLLIGSNGNRFRHFQPVVFYDMN